MAITLYIIHGSPPCAAVMMTLKHLGIEVKRKHLSYFDNDFLKPEYLKLNPQHVVPTIDDGGFILWESRAIQAYLVNKYAPGSTLYPEDPKERATVDRMLFFDIRTLYKAVQDYMFWNLVKVPGYEYPIFFRHLSSDTRKKEAIDEALSYLEEFLGRTPYVAGDHLTIADFAILASVSYAILNPNCLVPTIDDEGFILGESNAIMPYLIDQYAPDHSLYPKDLKQRAIIDWLLSFSVATMFKTLAIYLEDVMFKGQPPKLEKMDEFNKRVAMLEKFLNRSPYVAGEHMTIADISVLTNLDFAEIIMDHNFSEFPKVDAWMKKMKKEIPDYHEINVVALKNIKENHNFKKN